MLHFLAFISEVDRKLTELCSMTVWVVEWLTQFLEEMLEKEMYLQKHEICGNMKPCELWNSMLYTLVRTYCTPARSENYIDRSHEPLDLNIYIPKYETWLYSVS